MTETFTVDAGPIRLELALWTKNVLTHSVMSDNPEAFQNAIDAARTAIKEYFSALHSTR